MMWTGKGRGPTMRRDLLQEVLLPQRALLLPTLSPPFQASERCGCRLSNWSANMETQNRSTRYWQLLASVCRGLRYSGCFEPRNDGLPMMLIKQEKFLPKHLQPIMIPKLSGLPQQNWSGRRAKSKGPGCYFKEHESELPLVGCS